MLYRPLSLIGNVYGISFSVISSFSTHEYTALYFGITVFCHTVAHVPKAIFMTLLPICVIVWIVELFNKCSLNFSNDDKNIHDCITTRAQYEFLAVICKAFSINATHVSDFELGYFFVMNSVNFASKNLLPKYGGFVITHSYFCCMIRACLINWGNLSRNCSVISEYKSPIFRVCTAYNLSSQKLKSKSFTSRIEPYSLASLNVCCNKSICDCASNWLVTPFIRHSFTLESNQLVSWIEVIFNSTTLDEISLSYSLAFIIKASWANWEALLQISSPYKFFVRINLAISSSIYPADL